MENNDSVDFNELGESVYMTVSKIQDTIPDTSKIVGKIGINSVRPPHNGNKKEFLQIQKDLGSLLLALQQFNENNKNLI